MPSVLHEELQKTISVSKAIIMTILPSFSHYPARHVPFSVNNWPAVLYKYILSMQIYVLRKQRTKLAPPTSLNSPCQWVEMAKRIQPRESQRKQGDRSKSHCTAINTKCSTSLCAAKEVLVPKGLQVFCLPDFKQHQQQTQNQQFLFFQNLVR